MHTPLYIVAPVSLENISLQITVYIDTYYKHFLSDLHGKLSQTSQQTYIWRTVYTVNLKSPETLI